MGGIVCAIDVVSGLSVDKKKKDKNRSVFENMTVGGLND